MQLFFGEGAGFVFQHDGDTVADRESQLGLAAPQFLAAGMLFERAFGERANEEVEVFFIHSLGSPVGWVGAAGIGRERLLANLLTL